MYAIRISTVALLAALAAAAPLAPAFAQSFTPQPRVLSAVVDENALLLRWHRVVAVERYATGRYRVWFARRVDNCVYVASARTTRAVFVDVTEVEGAPRVLEVVGHDHTGAAADVDFTVMASCPRRR